MVQLPVQTEVTSGLISIVGHVENDGRTFKTPDGRADSGLPPKQGMPIYSLGLSPATVDLFRLVGLVQK